MKPRYQIRWYAQLEHGLAGGTLHFETLADAVGYWDGMELSEPAAWHRELAHCNFADGHWTVIMNESNNGGTLR